VWNLGELRISVVNLGIPLGGVTWHGTAIAIAADQNGVLLRLAQAARPN
jgi:hypothetical protein